MATPLFAFRLPSKSAARLRDVARIYGSPNPSAFLREMVSAICSGDGEIAGAFTARLGAALQKQMELEIEVAVGPKPVKRSRRKRRRKGSGPP